jgi:hypothetical protein
MKRKPAKKMKRDIAEHIKFYNSLAVEPDEDDA